MFVTIHGEVLNSATIIETIPASGSIEFDDYLDKYNYDEIKHCHKIKWSVREYSKSNNTSTSSGKKPKQAGRAYAITRTYDANVGVTGRANHNSDQFKLETGLYIAKVRHKGSGSCYIRLLHSDGTYADKIASGYGPIKESNTVRVDNNGYYLLLQPSTANAVSRCTSSFHMTTICQDHSILKYIGSSDSNGAWIESFLGDDGDDGTSRMFNASQVSPLSSVFKTASEVM